MKRIRRLLYPQGVNSAWMPIFAALILVVTGVAIFAAWSPALSQQGSAAAQQMRSAEASAYDRWLNEEVVYIIDDLERVAFLKLTTNEERDKFIEQFWERRNPTPGSAKNKVKEELYRRIGYANEHFATSRPGWQTDRGRMYIVYGPLDEIESHPNEDASKFAREIWMYHHIEGIGDNVSVTFVDRSKTGDYRLAPGKAQ